MAADYELAALTEDTTPDYTDWAYLVDSAGTVDKKVSVGNLLGASLLTFDKRFAAGLATIPRELILSNALTNASGALRLSYFTAPEDRTYTGVRVLTGNTAAAATPTLIRFGIYSVAGNGDITLIGSTPNDTTLLAAANTRYSKALSVSTPLTRGSRYAFAHLVVTGAATPTYPGLSPGSGLISSLNLEMGEAPRLGGNVTGQTDLPSSVTAASIADSSHQLYAVLTF